METKSEMIHVALRSGFTFKKVFCPLDTLLENYSVNGVLGISDEGNTYSHPALERIANKSETPIKNLFGIRLTVVKDAAEKIPPRGQFGKEHIIIAKNSDGVVEIYDLVKINYENFYYRGNISQHDLNNLTDDVYVIAPDFTDSTRIDFVELSPRTPRFILKNNPEIKRIAMVDNYYPTAIDNDVYELFTAPRNTNDKVYPQHIMTTAEWKMEIKRKFPDEYFDENINSAISNTHFLAEGCSVIKLEKAPMIKYDGKESIEFLCRRGAKKRGINIKSSGEYRDRYEREMSLIKDRKFDDYFLIVANMILKAKKKMLVGPSRGSSAGSLVCFLLGITEVDPLKYGLLFERFIDINRNDLPDIDIDFPDTKRDGVIKELIKTYGKDKVKHISIVSRMKAKSAIGEWAKGLRVPEFETTELKKSVIERQKGDSRFGLCLLDTFETTDVGKTFLENFPSMASASRIENHPRHHGVHAAGIIVCNDPIEFYAGVNPRDDTVMVDKNEAEYLNLLKIDVLGLRTLSVLEEAAERVGMDFHDFYTLPLDDEKTYKLFSDFRLSGIFQFEGYSLGQLTRQMEVECFTDITAITALARPAALYSGGASRYTKYRNGEEKPKYVCELHEKVTGETFGIVVYQEQILQICREIGKMDWCDVNALRKALSKSLGDEFFEKYKERFLKGASENNILKDDAEFLWGEVCHGGNYAFNKCLSGDTKIIMQNTGGHLPTEMALSDLYEMYIENPNYYIKKRFEKGFGIPLLSLYPDGRCRPQYAINIFKNGLKECSEFTTSHGHKFTCTLDHKFIINGEWMPIGSAKVGSEILIGEYEKQKYKNGRIKRYEKGLKTKSVFITEIKKVGEVETYDIEMKDHHNFLIEGGIITHNSHAVSYAMVSYWTAYMKAHHPLEFTVANLNNSKDDEAAMKILRDAVTHDGLEYIALDPDESEINWSVHDGKMIGGLTNLDGVGVAKARKIIQARSEGTAPTPALMKKLLYPKTFFDILFPTQHYWGDVFDRPRLYGLGEAPYFIKDILEKGEYVFIGKLILKNVRDLNEYANLQKRGGKVYESHSIMLSIQIEDDTDSIMCNVDRFRFEEIGREIAEHGVVGEDWFIIRGEIKWEARYIQIEEITKLDESMIEPDWKNENENEN